MGGTNTRGNEKEGEGGSGRAKVIQKEVKRSRGKIARRKTRRRRRRLERMEKKMRHKDRKGERKKE